MTTIAELDTSVFAIDLPEPEADGTLGWDKTTVVTITTHAGDASGLGWTYGPSAIAAVIDELLAEVVTGQSTMNIGQTYLGMRRATRNAPTPGLVSLAISAVDVALWDLKAKLLNVPLTVLFGQMHDRIPLYGSGGFTTQTEKQLGDQLDGWLSQGLTAVKIKIAENSGDNVDRDLRRIAFTRATIGPDVALMVDANGGYTTKQAARLAETFAHTNVTWFEEPVSSDHLADLALLRSLTTADITAGEYGTTVDYFNAMCAARAVDCLQIDASRCGGYTGLFAAATLAEAYGLTVSTHCAPNLHAPAAAAIPNLRHSEWFSDHVAADQQVFLGQPRLQDGSLIPSDDTPGHGMRLRW